MGDKIKIILLDRAANWLAWKPALRDYLDSKGVTDHMDHCIDVAIRKEKDDAYLDPYGKDAAIRAVKEQARRAQGFASLSKADQEASLDQAGNEAKTAFGNTDVGGMSA